ncbi:DNA N-6-adenine-methyltransferase [Mariprofundus ferrooxydans]|uniref:DNA N-6-adenine-methyltransferase n=1 Tax=Mariprofundus ferrooxydans TaxID=314344 RepID=UPI00197FE9A0|nr:DNA N-6-adenine-methyltransferase [Mariprofundus ferrooxydans]
MSDLQMSLGIAGKGMSGHQTSHASTHEWLTPPEIIRALGHFDLDPCAPETRPWPTAGKHYTFEDNGLVQEWSGRVWMNPPYGDFVHDWMRRMVNHGNGIVLIFARTETATFFNYVWPHAHAILFIKGRLRFHKVDGSKAKNGGGAPSVLIAYGEDNADALQKCGIAGQFIRLDQTSKAIDAEVVDDAG